jgi:hypothetical protein
MYTCSIAKLDVADNVMCENYEKVKKCYLDFPFNTLDQIFKVALADRERFPNIKTSSINNIAEYFERWVKGYIDATNNPPSHRHASPKSACNDPAISGACENSIKF